MKKLLPQYLIWERGVVFGKGNASLGLDLSSFVTAIKRTKKKNNIHEVRLVFTSLFLRMSVDLIELDEKRMKWAPKNEET